MIITRSSVMLALAFSLLASFLVEAKQVLEFNDIFHFKSAKSTKLSENGEVLALSSTPYRGDSEGHVYHLPTNKLIANIANGYTPVINKDGSWVAFAVKPSLLAIETATKKEQKKLKASQALTLVNTSTAEQLHFINVADFKLSDNGQWLAYRFKDSDKKETKDNNEEKTEKKKELNAKKIVADKDDKAYQLIIVNLKNQEQHTIESVVNYDFSASNTLIAFNQTFKDLSSNNISIIDLANNNSITPLVNENAVHASKIQWHPKKEILAFSYGNYKNSDIRRRSYSLALWSKQQTQLKQINSPDKNWQMGKTAKLKWSEMGERLYFKNRP